MSKLVLDTVTGFNSISTINGNFEKLEQELQDKVLYRNNPDGEPNTLESPLDSNGMRIYNLPAPVADNDAARLQDVRAGISGLPNASLIPVTPAGGISSTNVQGALQELDTEKVNITDLVDPTFGDAMVGVRQPFVGSVDRTQHDKNADFLSIKDAVGIDPTGVLSSSAGFAVALATGRSIEIPDGTYKVSGLVMTADGQTLKGAGRGVMLVAETTTTPIITMSGNRQTISDIQFNGGAVPNDAAADFNAVKIGGSRNIVQRCGTFGVFTRGINMVNSLYCVVRDCNIDGYRKRAVSLAGGTFNRIEDNMLFDGSLTAPADAIVYVDNTPSTSILNNHITRGLAPGIKAIATPPPGGFSHNWVRIEGNDIDFLENWAIDIDGYWNVHINDNWCAGGQGSSSTGQIRIQNAKFVYVTKNDANGALLVSEGILIKNCAEGTVSQNKVQYNVNGIVVESSTRILVTENISGQMTGLPPEGVPMQVSYLGRSLAESNNCQFINNIAVSPTVAEYSGIDNSTILRPRTIANASNGSDAYIKDRSLYIGNTDVDQTSFRSLHFRTRHPNVYGVISGGYNDSLVGQIVADGFGIGIDNCGWRLYTRNGSGIVEALQLSSNREVKPGGDNVSPLGLTSFRWTQLSAATATINTSDEREKRDIVPIPNAVLDAWAAVEFVSYRWIDAVEKKGDAARVHYGVIAQRVKAVFEAYGIDPFASGILCYDEWEATPERTVHGENGEVILHDEARPAGNRYGVRYEEALVLEAALMRRELKRLKESV